MRGGAEPGGRVASDKGKIEGKIEGKMQGDETEGGEFDWAGRMGEYWLENLDRFEEAIAGVGAALLRNAAFRPGERVVEIGSGGGRMTADIARAVGPGGQVVGIDVSPLLATEARRWVAAAGLGNVRIDVADAGTAAPSDAPFDRLISRFGIMFFADPEAGFRNLKRLVRAGGRFDAAVWSQIADNPWRRDVLAVIRRHLPFPAPEPRASGPFALGERSYFRALLEGAGFDDVVFSAWEGAHRIGPVGASAGDAADFVFETMNLGTFLEEIPAAQRADVRDSLRRDLAELFAHNRDASGVKLGAKAWLVSAIA